MISQYSPTWHEYPDVQLTVHACSVHASEPGDAQAHELHPSPAGHVCPTGHIVPSGRTHPVPASGNTRASRGAAPSEGTTQEAHPVIASKMTKKSEGAEREHVASIAAQRSNRCDRADRKRTFQCKGRVPLRRAAQRRHMRSASSHARRYSMAASSRDE